MSSSLETILVYRIADLPPLLAERLPEGSGPHRCLFWIAPPDSQAIDALMEGLAEPEIDHAEEGLDLSQLVAELAGRSRLLAELLRPEDVPPLGSLYFGTYQMGFHTAEAEEARAFLAGTGARLLPLDAIFGRVALARVQDDRGEPPVTMLLERWVREDAVGLRSVEPTMDGLLTIEIPEVPYLDYALFGMQQGLDLEPPRGGDVLSLVLAPEAPPPAPAARFSPPLPSSPAEVNRGVAIVGEVFASALTVTTPEGRASLTFRVEPCAAEGVEATGTLEVHVDGQLRKVGSGPVRFAPRPGAWDEARLRNLVRGARRAIARLEDVEWLMPEDFLPVELLVDDALTTEDDFAANAFALAPIARVRAPEEVPAVLARHGHDPVDAAASADLWCLLPTTVVERRWTALHTEAARAAAERLAASPPGRALLTLAADEWITRVLVDRGHAASYLPLYETFTDLLGATAGFDAVRTAGRRAVSRWRAGRG
jgi:hypothetical protein